MGINGLGINRYYPKTKTNNKNKQKNIKENFFNPGIVNERLRYGDISVLNDLKAININYTYQNTGAGYSVEYTYNGKNYTVVCEDKNAKNPNEPPTANNSSEEGSPLTYLYNKRFWKDDENTVNSDEIKNNPPTVSPNDESTNQILPKNQTNTFYPESQYPAHGIVPLYPSQFPNNILEGESIFDILRNEKTGEFETGFNINQKATDPEVIKGVLKRLLDIRNGKKDSFNVIDPKVVNDYLKIYSEEIFKQKITEKEPLTTDEIKTLTRKARTKLTGLFLKENERIYDLKEVLLTFEKLCNVHRHNETKTAPKAKPANKNDIKNSQSKSPIIEIKDSIQDIFVDLKTGEIDNNINIPYIDSYKYVKEAVLDKLNVIRNDENSNVIVKNKNTMIGFLDIYRNKIMTDNISKHRRETIDKILNQSLIQIAENTIYNNNENYNLREILIEYETIFNNLITQEENK